MDPATALGIASSVVQFVDFACKLISGSYAIYKSENGASEANSDLENITSSLASINNDLLLSLQDSNPASDEERNLNDLCKACNGEANQLLAVLQSLKVQTNHKAWKSFKAALKTIWEQEKIRSMQSRLDSFRQQITMIIVASLRSQMNSLSGDKSYDSSKQDDPFEAARRLNQTLLENMDKHSRWQAKVINSVSTGSESNTAMNQLYGQYAEDFNRGLLSLLRYKEMTFRYDSIPTAHEETFEWIFQPESKGQKRSSFANWLQSDNELYWITGKPGAGKSTLMKLICDDERTRSYLKKWAKLQRLYIFSFYFWNAGHDELQMSQEGLVRTILHDAMQQIPVLIPKVFATRLETSTLLGSAVAWKEPFGWSELLQATRIFIQEARRTKKLVFLIDGLDEFHGKQSCIIDLIHSLRGPNVKICVSSRPYVSFEDAFHTTPSLRLEDLSYSDISLFVESKLAANPAFLTLRKHMPEKAKNLIENVTSKASGVFLWVYLVTESLLEGLTEGERLSELQERLNSLPADLEELFWKILQSLGPRQFARASQLFQIHLASTKVPKKIPNDPTSQIEGRGEGSRPSKWRDTMRPPPNRNDLHILQRRGEVVNDGIPPSRRRPGDSALLQIRPLKADHVEDAADRSRQHTAAQMDYMENPFQADTRSLELFGAPDTLPLLDSGEIFMRRPKRSSFQVGTHPLASLPDRPRRPRGYDPRSSIPPLSSDSVQTPLTLIEFSYADEDDMDLVFDIPIGGPEDAEADYRAKAMKRRLTACCKCLLQVHSPAGSVTAESTVSYLHKAVKDFIQKPAIWNKLVEATNKDFDLNLNLYALHLTRLKFSLPHEAESGRIWLKAMRCMNYALEVRGDFYPEQNRLLGEIDFACAQLTAKNLPVDRKSWTKFFACREGENHYWTRSIPVISYGGTTFLHLAVKYQLLSYVEETLADCRRTLERELPRQPNRGDIEKDFQEHISSLLAISLFDYDILHPNDSPDLAGLSAIAKLELRRPNLALVRTLLDHGANPNTPLFKEKNSIWEAARRTYRDNSELLDVFSDYGAGPRSSLSFRNFHSLGQNKSHRLQGKNKGFGKRFVG